MSNTIDADPVSALHDPESVPSNWEHTLWGWLLLASVPVLFVCFAWMGWNMWCDAEATESCIGLFGLNVWCDASVSDCAARSATAETWRQAGGIVIVAMVLLVALRYASRHQAVFFTRSTQPRG